MFVMASLLGDTHCHDLPIVLNLTMYMNTTPTMLIEYGVGNPYLICRTNLPKPMCLALYASINVDTKDRYSASFRFGVSHRRIHI